jgi:hypothetical protein
MPEHLSTDAAGTLAPGQRLDLATNVGTRERWRHTFDRPTRWRPGTDAGLAGGAIVIVETHVPTAPICVDDLEVLADTADTVPDPEPVVVEVTARARDLIARARTEDP